MADVHDIQTRSYNMSQIKGKDTKPELLVRKFLFSHGFRFRLHKKTLPGRPDIVLTKYRVVIFVHGCFWHGHEGCKYFVIPKTRTEWWLDKISRNKELDSKHTTGLKDMGWEVMIVFECELKKNKIESTFEKILHLLEDKRGNTNN